MKVTIWIVKTVHESGGYCFWTKKEALEYIKKWGNGGRIRTDESQDDDEYPWSIEKEVIVGSTRSVCSELVNWGVECAGGHEETWAMK